MSDSFLEKKKRKHSRLFIDVLSLPGMCQFRSPFPPQQINNDVEQIDSSRRIRACGYQIYQTLHH